MAKLGVSGAIVQGIYHPGDISIRDGVVAEIGLPPGKSGIAIPGFVDLQVNGFAGVDFATATADDWNFASQQLAQTGVTTYLANVISSHVTDLEKTLAVAKALPRHQEKSSATLAGIHLEGPFLAEAKAGIHPTNFLREPDSSLLDSWINTGPVVMVTIAPELPGALSLIEELSHKNIVTSLGHSNCTSEQAQFGFDAGATSVTHLFNGMSGITGRSPGLAGAALAQEDIWLQVILDYTHVDRVLLELLAQCAPKRLVFVTDCLPATGTSATAFTLGETQIQIVDGKAVNKSGVLAGSILTMGESLRNAIECGMDEVDAINATSLNPLRLLDPAHVGPLAPGSSADIVVLSDSYSPKQIFLGGVEIQPQDGF